MENRGQVHYRRGYGVDTSYVPNGGLLRERRTSDRIFDWGLEPGRHILFLGRFSPEKGCHLLLEAYEKLDTEVKLVMAGASSYCDAYSRRMWSRASERIKMLAWVSGEALDELLTNAMLFVCPPISRAYPWHFWMRWAPGCVSLVSSDVAENREAIEDAGFIFRRGDVEDLADRLRFLIANPAVREAAGQAAERRIRAIISGRRLPHRSSGCISK